MKSFAPSQKETKRITPQLLIYWCKCQKQPLEVFCQKRVFFKISQNPQETPVPEETPMNFAKFLRTPFLQNNSGRLLLKCGHGNSEARDVVEEGWIQCLLLRLKSQSARKTSRHRSFMGICPTISHKYSLIYLIDEFFWFLVQPNETRLREYKLLSFCFWC